MSDNNQTPWFLYILSCSDRTLYTGITTDLERRVKQHNQGKGAAYTAQRAPVSLLAAWRFPDRAKATRAEHAMKRLRRVKKQEYVAGDAAFQDGTRLK